MFVFVQAESIPAEVIRRIAREIKELTASPLEGIKINLNEEDITDVLATIEGPSMYFTTFKLCSRVSLLMFIVFMMIICSRNTIPRRSIQNEVASWL